MYFEDKAVQLELRSLWILKLSCISYGRAFIEYGQTFRLCHMTSRLYLGVVNKQLVMVDSKDATREYTSFCFVSKGVSKGSTVECISVRQLSCIV